MESIKKLILNKSFIMGVIITIAIFSKYIFGPNNLLEEIVELIYKIETNNDVNFSPEVPEEENKDLNRIWKKHMFERK